MSTRRRTLYFYQHKKTKNWIAGINSDGSYEYSPKMCDAMLFFPLQALASSFEHKKEYVEVKLFTPPKPRVSRAKKSKAKSTKKPVSQRLEGVNPELVSGDKA